ncbi:MAG: hypothetical protein ABIF82_10765 [Planctomycetota bacterium]
MLSEATRDKLDGLVNPLLVKEMYQSLHNKKFLTALWLMLGCSLVAYVTIFAASRGKACGDDMFAVFSIFMYIGCVFVLPYLAFSNLSEEVKSGTLELVHITRMSSRKHVRGRLLASLVKIGLVFSMIGPFAVAAFLFKGIGVAPIIIILILALLFSVFACTVGIFFAALTSQKQMRSIAKGLFVLLLVWALFLPFSVAGEFYFFREIFGSGGTPAGWLAEALAVLGASAAITLLWVWFLCAASANILTFEADKCSARTKFILLAIIGAHCAAFSTPVLFGERIHTELIMAFALTAAIPLMVCGSFWLTGPSRVAYRFQKKFKKRDPTYQAWLFPFMDGAGSSALYLFVAFGLIFAGTLFMLLLPGGDFDDEMLFPVVICIVYPLFFSAVSRGIVRLLPKRLRTIKILRGVFLGLIAVNLIVPIILLAALDFSRPPKPSPLTGPFPLIHLMSLDRAPSGYGLLRLFLDLAVPALIGVTVHLVVMARHFGRYMGGKYD